MARLAALIVVLIAPVVALAQPVADRVPADSIIYIGWRGSADLGPAYQQSNLKAVLDDSDIPEFINQFLPKVMDKVGQMNPQAGGIAQIVATIARPTWQHPTAFFFAGVDQPQGGPPVPHLGIIWQPGADADALQKQLEQLLAQVQPPFPAKVIRDQQLVALIVGYDNPQAALAGGNTKALADDASFKAALSRLTVKDPVAAVYIDYQRLLELLDNQLKQSGDVQSAKNWPAMRDQLGLKGIKRVVIASGFDGKDWGTQAFLEAPEPRTGLLKAWSGEPLDNAILAAIPDSVTAAGALRLDVEQIYTTIHKAAETANAEGAQEFDSFLDKIHTESGVDIEKDLLASMGDEWAYYTDSTLGGRGPMSLTVVNHLKDPAGFEQSLSKIEDYAAKQIQEQFHAPITLAFHETKVDGMTVHYLGVPFVAPSWVVSHGNVYVALFPQVAASAASRAAKNGKSILQNEKFVALESRLGHKNPASFNFADLPQTAPDVYNTWLFITRLAGFGDLYGITSPPMILPQLDKLEAHLSPAGAVGWQDADGFYSRAIEPFPGSTLLSSNAGVMVASTSFAVSALLPALNRAREQANRIKSASNLRQIGQAAQMYANTHNGQFPADLGTLIKEEDLTPNVFINPRVGEAPPPPANRDQLPDWVNKNSEYVWLGAGKKVDMPADAVLAYEKLEQNREGVNLLFGDGHVEFMSIPEARQAIERSQPGNAPRVNGNL